MKIPRLLGSVRLCMYLTPLFVLSASTVDAQPDSDSLRFHWAFVAYPNPDSRPLYRPVIIDRDTILYSGDYFKLFVKPLTECYAYVFWHDSRKELKVLFPYNLGQFDDDWEVDKQYCIPKGRDWYQLDQRRGQEELHMLVSRKRLLGLERLLDSYASAEERTRKVLKLRVLNEIRELKKRFRTHKSYAERPATIAGTIRDPFERETPAVTWRSLDIAKYAKAVEGETFFSKTVIIKHK